MLNKTFINNLVKIGIKKWLKSFCSSIDILNLKLILNNENFAKVDEIYLQAKNLIYQGLYINKIIIKIHDFNLKFNYRNNFIYSDNLIINCFLTIDKTNLENIIFSNKFESFRIKIENDLTQKQAILNLDIYNDLITFSYKLNKLNKEINVSLNLSENLIFLEDIINKKKIFLPVDKNIKFNNCRIKDELINIDLSSKVIFDN